MTIPLAWVDAFSDAPFGGNPAGVCLLDQPLDEARMQSIAFELGIAETAFLVPDERRAHHVRAALVLPGHRDRPLRPRHPRLGPCPASVGDRRRHVAAHLPHQERPAARRLRRRPRRPRLPSRSRHGRPATRRPWRRNGRVGSCSAATPSSSCFVVLASAEAVRAYEPDLEAIAATGAKALLLTAAADPASGADYVLRVFGPERRHPRGPRHRARPSARPARTGPRELGRERPGGAAALPHAAPRSTCAPRASGCGSAAMQPPCWWVTCAIISPAMGATTADLRALVEGHQPADAAGGGGPGAFPRRAGPPPGSLRRARRPHARHRVGHRGRTARHGAAPPQAPRHLDAARRPHRRRRDPRRRGPTRGHRGARPRRRAPGERPAPHQHRRARRPPLATRISTCATCWSPATTTRTRRRARAPRHAGTAGTRRSPWPTPRLADALPVARVAYETERVAMTDTLHPSAGGAGPRHLDHPDAAPTRRPRRVVRPRRRRGRARDPGSRPSRC